MQQALALPAGFLEFDPRLVEEAVLRALWGRPQQESELHARRVPLYDLEEPQEREERFAALYAEWFERLGLALPFRAALAEQPLAGLRAFLVRATQGKQDEGADLYAPRGDGPRRPLAVLCLRPTTLIDAASVWLLLRRELLHLADMLDPDFGYDPQPPRSDVGPAYDALLLSRYRAVWETTVMGRMLRRGWVGAGARERSLARFTAAFPMLGERTGQCFATWFDRDRVRHGDFLEFAQNPGGGSQSSRCPLCRFPTARLERPRAAAPVATGALDAIRHRHPDWRPEAGICAQCADVYGLSTERQAIDSPHGGDHDDPTQERRPV